MEKIQTPSYVEIALNVFRYAAGAVMGVLAAATILVVFAVIFSANMSASYDEFMSLFRGHNFIFNLLIGALFGLVSVFAKRHGSRHYRIGKKSGYSGVHGGSQQAFNNAISSRESKWQMRVDRALSILARQELRINFRTSLNPRDSEFNLHALSIIEERKNRIYRRYKIMTRTPTGKLLPSGATDRFS